MQLSLKVSALAALAISLIFNNISSAQAINFKSNANYAYMIDHETGDVLYEKNADEQIPPSSMTKLMTMYILFDALKHGELKLDDGLTVSENAWRKGGSKMYVPNGKKVKVEDLIQGIIVSSGNDACIVVAENIAGSEEDFAQIMNKVAADIGLTGSYFKNSTGWPDEEHLMTLRDLGILSSAIIREFPEYYHYFAQETFRYSKIKQQNRNRLLFRDIGIDGLKTGHTQKGGYGIAVSGQQDGRRVIAIVNGLDSDNARISEAERMYNYGMRNFVYEKILDKDTTIENVKIWGGTESSVPAILREDVQVMGKKTSRYFKKKENDVTISITYKTPLVAPIEKDAQIATLNLMKDKTIFKKIPLYAANTVAKADFWGQMKNVFLGMFL